MVSKRSGGWGGRLRGLWRSFAEEEGARFRFLIVASVCFFVVLVTLALFGQGGWWEVRRVERDAIQLQEEISQLRQENDELRKEIVRLRTDPVLLERIARDELGMGRPGEIVYEIIDREQETDEPAAGEAEPRTDEGGTPSPER